MNAVEQILKSKIVAIVRLADYSRAVETAQALSAGGVTVLEFTLTGQGAMEAVAAARKALGGAVCVGVGSVIHAEQAEACIDAGAEFVVTPAVRLPVIAACVARRVPCAAGGYTPTELLTAHEAGCELVKLFPASLGGPRYIKDVLAPLPFLKLVPTGGISAENARDYLAAGAAAVGMGGALINAKAIAAGEFDKLTAAAREAVAAVSGGK
jgi:2-dehydro-3-deoxyphosphogluconate aldolase/(4S)-4-hydroxy-2-oxoglutarate aldolase